MIAVRLVPGGELVTNADGIVRALLTATAEQLSSMAARSDETLEDLLLSTDALNFHRIEWRLREELGQWEEEDSKRMSRVKMKLCKGRSYEPDEFEAALVATKKRPRLPFGWTALDFASHRLLTRPIRLLDDELESSRYTRGVMGLAIHLQEIQKEEPILLPVEQVRDILKAKKVVIAGTITKLVETGMLEMTKADYHTGSAREFRFRGVKGKDYVFISELGEEMPKRQMTFDDV